MRLPVSFVSALWPVLLFAQQPVTRSDAVAAALARGARVALGRADTTAALGAARYRSAFERAAIRFDVDTTYTRGLAAELHARLSHRTALDADSLLRIAELRQQAGDVSELDVRLAAVNAGQLANVAADDSLTALSTLLSLQLQMGLTGDQPTIALVDSLRPQPDSALTEGRVLLP